MVRWEDQEFIAPVRRRDIQQPYHVIITCESIFYFHPLLHPHVNCNPLAMSLPLVYAFNLPAMNCCAGPVGYSIYVYDERGYGIEFVLIETGEGNISLFEIDVNFL